jgi:hypothetical protein
MLSSAAASKRPEPQLLSPRLSPKHWPIAHHPQVLPILIPVGASVPTHALLVLPPPAIRPTKPAFEQALLDTNLSLFTAADAANLVIDPVTGASLVHNHLIAGPDGKEWIQSNPNEIGRLTQGTLPDMPSGTNTIVFLPHTAVPVNRKATYLRIVAKIRPEKKENKYIDHINYPGKVSTPTADITTAKCLLNSVVSTPGAKFMTIDLANFYLNTPMERFEYMRIPLSAIPTCIMEQYNLEPLVHNGFVMVEIRKGMYAPPKP